MNKLVTPATIPSYVQVVQDTWNEKYLKGLLLWGENPSKPATHLAKLLSENTRTPRVFEVGGGYGRDAYYLAEQGADVYFSEVAREAGALANKFSADKANANKVTPIWSNFTNAIQPYAPRTFDAFYSHRTLHLLQNGLVDAFRNAAAKLVDDNGLLLVTARSVKDFDPVKMDWMDEQAGIATYKESVDPVRYGMPMNLYTEEKIINLFQDDFYELTTVDGVEEDSVEDRRDTHYISIKGYRKPRPPRLVS